MRSLSRAILGISAAALIGIVAPRPADAAIVERIVAVVGERPILLSELRHRARPHLYRIAASTQNPTEQAARENELFRELLNRMIDERLEEQAADKAHLTVTPEEVDAGIRQVAAQAKIPPKELINEAKRQGLTEQDYRDEIRRQVLEGKLINLRVSRRVRVNEADARAAYAHWVKELEQQSPVELRLLVLHVPPGMPDASIKAKQTLAENLVARARGGEDFCELVSNYSEDPTTKSTCGTRGPVPLQMLLPELQQVATKLKPGEVGEPLMFRDPMGTTGILVPQLASQQPKIPPYEEVKDEMFQRAFLEATDRQRKLWLQELRRGVYIDVRL